MSVSGTQGHALVTGASSGIGAAIVVRLLADGWQVSGVARRRTTFESPAYRGVEADLAETAGCQSVLAAVRGVTAFVHAAGFMATAPLGQLDPAQGEAMWRLHVAAAAILANGLVPAMGAGGRIVLIGSRTASGAAGRSQYAATKAAMTGMVRSWAIELAPAGITANIVAPAATETAMLTAPGRDGAAPRMPPMGRFIRAEEVAAGVAYLVSPAAAPVTGQTLTLCGGASL